MNFIDNKAFPYNIQSLTVTDPEEIHKVSKALSDEFRVKIISTLIEGPPQRYSDLLHKLYTEGSGDSGKLAYHLNILSASGLVTKVNDRYRVTEMGCQVYASMKQTVDDWDELTLREDLKNYSAWDVTFLLWSDSFQNIGSIITPLGVIFTINTGKIVHGIIPLLGVILLLLSRRSKPGTSEEKRSAVKHLKQLLGGNRLLPGLINALGILGSTVFVAYALLVVTNYTTFNSLLRIVMLEVVLGLTVAAWLTRRMGEVWKDFRQGRKPKNYGDTLQLIASTAIQFNVAISIIYISQMLKSGSYHNIWFPIQLILASYNLFKDTIPSSK